MREGAGMLEDEINIIDFLKFSLKKKEVSSMRYYVSNEDRDILEFGNQECVICIAKYKGQWTTCIQSDRYAILDLKIHSSIYEAADDFWFRILKNHDFYECKRLWDIERT
jgi:hypothetical protein